MKKSIGSFSDVALTREQQRSVSGGGCQITFDTRDGGCASITGYYAGSQSGAANYANKQMGKSINGSSTITGYNIYCS